MASRRTPAVVIALCALVAQLAPLVHAPDPAAAAPPPVRIMPLGDSITHGLNATHACGCGVPGAYRINLDAHLRTAGYAFDFVGGQWNGPQPDKNHQGHPGYRIDEIHNGRAGMNTGVNGWLPKHVPAVVLLLIGTNDVLQNRDLANAPNRLSALIDRIIQLRPTATVYVATIPPLVGPKAHLNEKVKSYNTGLRNVVASKAAAGKLVRLVDVYPALTSSDLAGDGVHPTRGGYDRIARIWADALLGAQPTDTTPPTVSSRSPAPDASGVGPASNVTATFSEALNPATVSGSTFTLAPASGPAVSATVSNSPNNLATLDPTADLQSGITYTATLNGGAAGITDAAGNPLDGVVSWSFTTATAPPPPPPPTGEWSHVGTGPLATMFTAAGTTVGVSLPAARQAGDLLLLGCQGRDNPMDWSAPDYTSLMGPIGPGGLPMELQYTWASGSEPDSVTVTNTTGRNGWSCSITALRGGVGSGNPLAAPVVIQTGSSRTMTAPALGILPDGALVTRWFASADDNAHGTPSEGTLAFGGSAYDGVIGVHHSSSMSYLVHTPAGPRGSATMLENVNYSDAFIGVSVALLPGSAP